jgi:biotin carboxylase
MKTAIVLGGTHDHITLIQKIKNLDYRTILVDYFDNPPAAEYADIHIKESALDEEKVLELAIQFKADLVIATCIDQPLLTVASVSEKLNLPCHINYETALALTNKTKMKARFVEFDISTSKFVILKPNEKIPIDLKYPLVVKPADSNSSKGIKKVWNEAELELALIEAFDASRSKNAIVEEFQEGEEFSIDVAVSNGKAEVIMISSNVKSKIDETRFTITESLYVQSTEVKLKDAVQEIAQKIAIAFGLKDCPILIQLINNNGYLSVIEFSARIGGGSKHHFIKHITKIDLLDFFLKNVIGKSNIEDERLTRPEFGLIKYIYCNNGKIAKFNGFEELKNEIHIIDDYFFYKTLGMTINGHNASSDRPAGILITASNEVELKSKMEKSLSKIEILDSEERNLLLKN